MISWKPDGFQLLSGIETMDLKNNLEVLDTVITVISSIPGLCISTK